MLYFLCVLYCVLNVAFLKNTFTSKNKLTFLKSTLHYKIQLLFSLNLCSFKGILNFTYQCSGVKVMRVCEK